jgi:hypothetical protein
MWVSITSPSSALVATIVVAAPFFFLALISMRFGLFASKLLWLFFIVFLSYLILAENNNFSYIYLIFLVLSFLMLFFDSTVRHFIHGEKEKLNLEAELANMDVKKRYKLRQEIEEYYAILNDSNTSNADKLLAQKKLSQLKKQYGQDLSSI